MLTGLKWSPNIRDLDKPAFNFRIVKIQYKTWYVLVFPQIWARLKPLKFNYRVFDLKKGIEEKSINRGEITNNAII